MGFAAGGQFGGGLREPDRGLWIPVRGHRGDAVHAGAVSLGELAQYSHVLWISDASGWNIANAQTTGINALFRMSAVSSSGTGGTVHNLAYSLDAVGNLSQRQDLTQGVTENFSYDTLNRLTSASGSGLTTRSFD